MQRHPPPAAGRLDENKNHVMLIHAFAKIAEEYPKVKLVIYGVLRKASASAKASPTGTSSPFTPFSINAAGPPQGQSVDMTGIPSKYKNTKMTIGHY